MKIIASFILLIILSLNSNAQTTNVPKIYHPEANAQADIDNALAKALKNKKHVFIQVGGNWCVWRIRFDKLVKENEELSKIMTENYEIVHLNYSKENKNEEILAKLEFPQRFGFPVFVILDSTGKRIHTQNSAYLEEGAGHSTKLISEFLQQWSPKSLDISTYSK